MKRIILLIVPLVIMSLACQSQAVDPAPAVVKTRQDLPTPPTAEKTALVCLAAETVRLRSGPGTSYDELELLSAGDKMTLLDEIAQSEDGGLWSKVSVKGQVGWINSRYICGADND